MAKFAAVPYDWSRWGGRVKALREERGWTQEELARRVGLHRVSLARLEAGARKPSVEVLDRLAGCFRIPLADLVTLPGRRR